MVHAQSEMRVCRHIGGHPPPTSMRLLAFRGRAFSWRGPSNLERLLRVAACPSSTAIFSTW